MNDKELKAIEDRLNAVEEARPGDWISVVGSGHNLCTAITAELVEGLEDEDGNRIDKPEACPYRDNPIKYTNPRSVQCKRYPMLRVVRYCSDPEVFPCPCYLTPTKVSYRFIADCLPDYVLKDDPKIPDHVPILKFLESIKPDVRDLIEEVKRLRKIEVAGIKHVVSISGTLDDSMKVAKRGDKLLGDSITREQEHKKEIEKLRDCKAALINLVDMIENEGLMPPSLSYFAEAKNAIEASEK